MDGFFKMEKKIKTLKTLVIISSIVNILYSIYIFLIGLFHLAPFLLIFSILSLAFIQKENRLSMLMLFYMIISILYIMLLNSYFYLIMYLIIFAITLMNVITLASIIDLRFQLVSSIKKGENSNSELALCSEKENVMINEIFDKEIEETKILDTRTQETAASRKKGKIASALTAGLTAGSGGNVYQTTFMAGSQEAHHSRNAKFETIVKFLIIYKDNSRKVADVVENGEVYNKLIMYIK